MSLRLSVCSTTSCQALAAETRCELCSAAAAIEFSLASQRCSLACIIAALMNAPKLDAIVGIVNMSWRLEWASRWPIPAKSSSEIPQTPQTPQRFLTQSPPTMALNKKREFYAQYLANQ